MKHITKFFILLLTILLLGGLFSACSQETSETPNVPDTPDEQEHVHESTHWYTDKISHWQICSCGETIDKSPHEGGTATNESAATCAVCGIKYGEHIHTAEHWQSNEEMH